jgi:hypothetical protein
LSVDSPSFDARAESALAAELTDELVAEFPHVAAGPVLAMVVRCIADLRRIAVSPRTAASSDDYRRVVLETARHQLARVHGRRPVPPGPR